MSDCSNAEMRDLLPDLLHAQLDAAARARVEAHLRACADCREELELLRGVRDAAPTPRVDVRAIVAAIPAYRRQRAWASPAWRAAAAIIFLAVGGSTVATLVHHSSVTDSLRVTQVASGNDSAVGAGDIELQVGYGYADLTDTQLTALLKDVQQMNAVPMSEPDISIPSMNFGNGGM